jgi:putative IMPACT (imprinted ancient) family translation regulator
VFRANDDGEPSGTAGAPMLEVLTRREISDVVVVVTRWFGGTLLGAGGLVRAYGDAVIAALDAAGEQVRELRHVMKVEAMPADAGALDNRLRSLGVVTDVSYGSRAVFTVSVIDPDLFERQVAEASAGRALVERVGTAWIDV